MLLPTILPIIVGCSLLWFYNSFISNYFPLGLQTHKVAILGITASFSFTLLGFLAAALTLFFTTVKSNTFDAYNNEGYLSIFLWRCYLTIISLAITFILSIVAFASYAIIFKILFIMVITNLAQFSIIIMTVINIVRGAVDESE